MANEIDVPAILAECTEDAFQDDQASTQLPVTSAIVKPVWIPTTVCSDIVGEACDALLADKCTSDEDCEVFRNVNRDALLSALQFLNACLVPKTRFKCASKEKAFQKFHQAMLVKLNFSPLENLLCPFTATTMAFTVFELLLKRNYDNKQTQSSNSDEVPEGEVGIVEHIAGFVLFNHKKQAKRMKNVCERELVEDCLKALETPEVVTTSKTNLPSLTQVLDRGGLTKPTQNVCQMFVALESIFRSTFGDNRNFDFQIYFSKCVASDSVSTCLYEGLYKVNAQDDTKEKLLRGIVKVYFNVRVHHECKVYMDKHKLSTKTGKQKKSLRKSLQEYRSPLLTSLPARVIIFKNVVGYLLSCASSLRTQKELSFFGGWSFSSFFKRTHIE